MLAIRAVAWNDLIETGATTPDMFERLKRDLGHGKKIGVPGENGGIFGYVLDISYDFAYFWLGTHSTVGRKCTLSGNQLIDQIRIILKIPTPTEARKKAQASFHEPTVTQKKPGGPVYLARTVRWLGRLRAA